MYDNFFKKNESIIAEISSIEHIGFDEAAKKLNNIIIDHCDGESRMFLPETIDNIILDSLVDDYCHYNESKSESMLKEYIDMLTAI